MKKLNFYIVCATTSHFIKIKIVGGKKDWKFTTLYSLTKGKYINCFKIPKSKRKLV